MAAQTGSILERRWAPLAAAAVALGLFVALALVKALADHRGLGGGILQVGFLTVALAVGLVIARHHPRNPIGWLVLAIPMCVLTFSLAEAVAVAAARHHPLVAAGAGMASELFYFAFLFCAPLVILFFPDGELPSSSWRSVVRAYLVLAVLAVLTFLSWAILLVVRGSWHMSATGNLTNGPPAGVTAVLAVLLVGCLGLALSWVVRRIAGYRHATAAVRQQYKWLTVGAVCLVVDLVLSFVTPGGSSTFARIDNVLTAVLALPFPVTIGIAILRYRLYDIDRVISRTVSYVLLTGVLAGLYVGLVAFTEDVLPFSSPVAVAASTLVAVAAFNPLRRRVQRVVDRRFNRSRYDAEATVAAFAERLRSTLVLGAVEEDLLLAVHRTLEPASASLWLRSGPRSENA